MQWFCKKLESFVQCLKTGTEASFKKKNKKQTKNPPQSHNKTLFSDLFHERKHTDITFSLCLAVGISKYLHLLIGIEVESLDSH